MEGAIGIRIERLGETINERERERKYKQKK